MPHKTTKPKPKSKAKTVAAKPKTTGKKITKALLVSIALLGATSASLAISHKKIRDANVKIGELAIWAGKYDRHLHDAMLTVGDKLQKASTLNMAMLKRIHAKLPAIKKQADAAKTSKDAPKYNAELLYKLTRDAKKGKPLPPTPPPMSKYDASYLAKLANK